MNENFKEGSLNVHKPVLVGKVNEIFDNLALLKIQDEYKSKPKVIDATVGGGGHAAEFVRRGVFVLGIDADEKMVEIAGDNMRKVVDTYFACPTGNYDNFFKIIKSNFARIDVVAEENGLDKVDLILFDLGISSYHYLFKNRGFSFSDLNSPLDMRLTESLSVKASDLLNALPKKALTELFSVTMSYPESVRLSEKVVLKRKEKPFDTVSDFSEIIFKSVGNKRDYKYGKKLSIETLPFLALRIAVNGELENLEVALKKSWGLIKKGGTLIVISFHSGEDRIVKNFFRELIKENKAEDLIGLVRPSDEEKRENPRSRSAKMRAIEKLN